jgi:hypothetical protein
MVQASDFGFEEFPKVRGYMDPTWHLLDGRSQVTQLAHLLVSEVLGRQSGCIILSELP